MRTVLSIFEAQDVGIYENLKKHLSPLEQGELIVFDQHQGVLNADIIFIFVNRDLISLATKESVLLRNIEIAMKRSRAGEADIIPIVSNLSILPSFWAHMPFSSLESIIIDPVNEATFQSSFEKIKNLVTKTDSLKRGKNDTRSIQLLSSGNSTSISSSFFWSPIKIAFVSSILLFTLASIFSGADYFLGEEAWMEKYHACERDMKRCGELAALLKEQCIEKKDRKACLYLGKLYHFGVGVTADLSEAIKCFRMACDLGLSFACNPVKR